MNKTKVIEKVVQKTEVSKSEVEKVVSSFLETIKSALKDKQIVRLVGFGTFSSNERKARIGRNPQTGEEVKIPSCHHPKFKPGKEFKEYLN
ncbi:MAG: HU family DNA-binding protein [Bdellovibrionaceae bacterium]|nr:HU family DNA-binding protein [Pseudobdellovibrionaceae bacterium]